MTTILESFKKSFQFWLCLVVYIWALEFQSIIPLSIEPLSVTIVDCSAALLTLAFWAMAASLLVATAATVLKGTSGAHFSKFICQGGMLVATGVYFADWLDRWAFFATRQNEVSFILFLCCVTLALLVWHRRKRRRIDVAVNLPSFEDCFRFGALPVVLCAEIIVSVQVFRHSLPSGFSTTRHPTANSAQGTVKSSNVILIVSDALSANHMSLYGYARKTTPVLDRLALNGSVYTKAHSNIPSTQISLTSLLTGKHPLHHGRLSFDQSPYHSDENLLNVLKNAGYTTAAVTTLWGASFHTLGFAKYLSVEEQLNFEIPSLHWLGKLGVQNTDAGVRMYYDLYGRMLIWLDIPFGIKAYWPANANLKSAAALITRLKQPFFIFIHLKEPHEPYSRPPRFRGIYATTKNTQSLAESSLALNAYYGPESQPTADMYRDRYDETIRFLDEALGEFTDFLSRTGRRENLLLVITADHGESFEHGYFGHGDDLHEPSMHVPLIVKWPFQKQGQVITEPVQSIDIAPTILHTLGIPVPGFMDGQSLSPQTKVKPSNTIAINQQERSDRTTLPNQLAIWSRHYKLILHCDTHKRQLFDLLSDPNETTNISSKQPLVLRDLTNRLKMRLQIGVGRKLLPCIGDS